MLSGEGNGSGVQSVKRHLFDRDQQVQAGWCSHDLRGSGTLHSSPAHNGRNTIQAVMAHGLASC